MQQEIFDLRKLGFMQCFGQRGFYVFHKPVISKSRIFRRPGFRCKVCNKFWPLDHLKVTGNLK